MPEIPEKLANTLDALSMVPDRSERIQLLIDIAGKFQDVPPQVDRKSTRLNSSH